MTAVNSLLKRPSCVNMVYHWFIHASTFSSNVLLTFGILTVQRMPQFVCSQFRSLSVALLRFFLVQSRNLKKLLNIPTDFRNLTIFPTNAFLEARWGPLPLVSITMSYSLFGNSLGIFLAKS